MMKERERETAFLRQCILYDDSTERQHLEEKFVQAERNERCVRHAVSLMICLSALALAGLCYSAVFLDEYPPSVSQLITQYTTKALCVLGLGSLICLLSFTGLGAVYRRQLAERRDECRRLATQLLESRLGKPSPMLSAGVVKEHDLHGVARLTNVVKLPKASAERRS